MKKIKALLLVLTAVLSLTLTPLQVSAANEIVQLSSMYSYEEMCGDIEELKTAYPEYIKVGSAGTTILGRQIPYVILGNSAATISVMVQASIHGREYLGTQMCMGMIEYYAMQNSLGNNLLGNVNFYIIPMANPDGVCISQRGSASVSDEGTKAFINTFSNYQSWKSNAMGVDLNRNFNIGWEALDTGAAGPYFERFKGNAPETENETKALTAFARLKNFRCYISYHQQGKIIYYDEPGNTAECSTASESVAKVLSSVNKYQLINLKSCISKDGKVVQGGFTDWVQIVLNKPAVTVELGSSLPPKGQKQIGNIYKVNRDSWQKLAESLSSS